MFHQAMLSRSLEKEYVQCTACEHWCAIAPDHAGKCGVRRNIDGALRLIVYGRAVAVHVDPVEKKPLHHLLPGSPIFSIGTYGCNLSCRWCQNWEISQHRHFDLMTNHLGVELPPSEIVETCLSQQIPLIAFTYNEPAVYFEYAYDTAKLAHAAGLRTVFVSSGFETLEAIDTIAPYLDAVNVDLKAFRQSTYKEYCRARLAPVKRNIQHLVQKTNIWTEVTTLVIPGLNDSKEELRDIARFLVTISPDLPWHVTGFRPEYQMVDRNATPASTLSRAWSIGKEAGLRYVYAGNIWYSRELEGCSDTTCPHCNQPLIQRQGYAVHPCWKVPGMCDRCGAKIAGVWT